MKKLNGLTAVVAVVAAMGVLAFTGLTQNASAKYVNYLYGDGLVVAGSGTLTGSLTAASVTATGSITVPASSIDTTKITGTFIGSDLASNIIDTTKISNSGVSGTGTLLCYIGNGKIGKVTAVVDTGVTGTCAPF